MEESSEGMDIETVKREQEKERRRVRDRQRRQSMSVEEREQHLARRRRNYQLRRQRAGHVRLNSQHGQTLSTVSRREEGTINEHQGEISASEYCVQSDGTACVGFVQGGDKLDSVCTKVDGLEAGAQVLVNIPGKLRLNHIKRLARSLNDPIGKLSVNNKIGAALLAMENATTNDTSPKRLRLSQVKSLARALTSSRESTQQNLHNETEGEQSSPQQGIQQMGSDVPNISPSNKKIDG
ncbi:uncharacterized protein LOC131153516 [Malania oleifera]|uniref:uncharacterized protein LOC131153516 n=1 Tax=Malania oleifera TaxID=397392 RepID=UPI0025AEC48B|nr:uncharacterized protein LOC131153516 [Malania oleifera]